MTQEEQIVMGAFWEACRMPPTPIPGNNVVGRATFDVALALAPLIRSHGIQFFDAMAAKAALDTRENHFRAQVKSAAGFIDALELWLKAGMKRNGKLDSEIDVEFLARLRRDAANLRALLEGP